VFGCVGGCIGEGVSGDWVELGWLVGWLSKVDGCLRARACVCMCVPSFLVLGGGGGVNDLGVCINNITWPATPNMLGSHTKTSQDTHRERRGCLGLLCVWWRRRHRLAGALFLSYDPVGCALGLMRHSGSVPSDSDHQGTKKQAGACVLFSACLFLPPLPLPPFPFSSTAPSVPHKHISFSTLVRTPGEKSCCVSANDCVW
jgi:hypothetical protein